VYAIELARQVPPFTIFYPLENLAHVARTA